MNIFGDHVNVPSDGGQAEWLGSRLGELGTVGALVPQGFEQYAFVRASSSDQSDDEAAELASELAALAEKHTTTPDLIWYAIWEGYGWETTMLHAVPAGPFAWVTRIRDRRRRRVADRSRADRVRRGRASVPSFDLPLRRYFLVSGPLGSVSAIASPDGFGIQVPDLWWPQDRNWFVATDTDLDWSYVGGTAHFVDDVANAITDVHPVEWTSPIASLT